MHRKWFGLACALLLVIALARGAPADEDASSSAVVTASVTVTYMDASDSIFHEEVLGEGQPVLRPAGTPQWEGHDFLFWYDPSVGKVPFGFGVAAEKDLVLWPSFETEHVAVAAAPAVGKAQTNSDDQGEGGRGRDRRTPAPTPTPQPEDLEIVIIDNVDGDDDSGDGNDDGDGSATCEVPVEDAERPKESTIHISSAISDGNIVLTANLVGFDVSDVSLQWQYASHATPDVWRDAPGATATTYSFPATPVTVNRSWRLVAIMKK